MFKGIRAVDSGGEDAKMVNINWSIFWSVVNFLILMYLLQRFLYKPITELLDKRENKINSDLDEANRQKEEARKIKEEYQTKLATADDEAQSIIQKAEQTGKKNAKEIVEEAREKAESLQEKKMEEINQAKRDALRELRKEVASLSLQIAARLIEKELDEKAHQKLVEKYIAELDQQKLGEL